MLRDFLFKFFGGGGVGYGGGYTLIRNFLAGTKIDYQREAGRIYDNSAVSSGVGWLWRNFQYPELVIQKRVKGRWEDVDEHPFPAIFNSPYSAYDYTTHWYGTILSYVVNGNAYWYKVTSDRGSQVLAYQYVPHCYIEPRADKYNNDGRGLVTYYLYRPPGSGEEYEIHPDRIVHLRHGVDPYNQMLGLAPVYASLREVVGDNQASTISTALTIRGGIAGVVLSPKQMTKDLTPDQKKAFEEKWIQNMVGDRAGTPQVLPFPVDVTHLGYEPDKLVLDKTRALYVSRILSGIGIDPMVLGLTTESKTHSNYEEANRSAYQNALLPYMAIWARQLTQHCLPDFNPYGPNYRVWWDTKDVKALQEDVSKLWRRVTLAYSLGQIKRLEGLKLLGLPYDEVKDDVYVQDVAQLKSTDLNPVGKVDDNQQNSFVPNGKPQDPLLDYMLNHEDQ